MARCALAFATLGGLGSPLKVGKKRKENK